MMCLYFLLFKQKTAYEMRISDWSSDVCSSDLQRQLSRTLDDRGVVTGEVVLGQQLAHFHFDQLEQLFVVDHVGLVQEHDDVRHAHLAREQDRSEERV